MPRYSGSLFSAILMAMSGLACLTIAGATEHAHAAYTLDRWYQMGDDKLFSGGSSAEGAVNNAAVGSNASISGVTYDSAATDNDNFQPLTAVGATGLPTYAQYGVGGNPVAPVAAAASMNSFGVRFDGVDDDLVGVSLNDPSVTAPGSMVSYNTRDRGFQFWAYPTAVDGTAEVMIDDADQHGFNINAAGNLQPEVRDNQIDSGVLAVQSAWTHFMVVHDSETQGAAVSYVNGLAVASQALDYNSSAVARLIVGADSEEDVGEPLDPAAGFFSGIIDEIELFVIDDGGSYGAFDYTTDNGYFTDVFLPTQSGYGFTLDSNSGHNSQNWVKGDIDFDGDLDADDVQAFIDGWLSSRADLPGVGLQAGDYQTLALGDLDLDGDTDVDDWFVLRQLGPALGPLPSLQDLRGVPEPCATALLTAGSLVACRPRRRAAR